MRVELSLRPTLTEHASISARQMDESLREAVHLLSTIGDDATVVEQHGLRNAIAASRGTSMVIVPIADIYLARADNGHVQLVTAKGELRSTSRLYELESVLGNDFIRISRSAIVNLNAIDRIDPGFGGPLIVKMTDGSAEWISRRFLPAFKAALSM